MSTKEAARQAAVRIGDVTQSSDLEAELRGKVPAEAGGGDVDKLFRARELEGSDLHLKVGRPPMVRTRGKLMPLNRPPIDEAEMVSLLFPMMDKRNRRIFDEDGGADFAYVVDVDGETGGSASTCSNSSGKIGLVARRVNNWIPDFAGLNLPPGHRAAVQI